MANSVASIPHWLLRRYCNYSRLITRPTLQGLSHIISSSQYESPNNSSHGTRQIIMWLILRSSYCCGRLLFLYNAVSVILWFEKLLVAVIILYFAAGAQPRLKSWGRPRYGSQHEALAPRARPKAGLGLVQEGGPSRCEGPGVSPPENFWKLCILVSIYCEISCFSKTTAKKLGEQYTVGPTNLKVGGTSLPQSLWLLRLFCSISPIVHSAVYRLTVVTMYYVGYVLCCYYCVIVAVTAFYSQSPTSLTQKTPTHSRFWVEISFAGLHLINRG